MRLTAMLAVMLSGCAAGGAALGAAAVNTAVALTASAVSRSQGECYASCPTGTRCEKTTGLCEPLPCRGTCRDDEHCEATVGGLERCVAGATLEIKDLHLDVPPARVTPQ